MKAAICDDDVAFQLFLREKLEFIMVSWRLK